MLSAAAAKPVAAMTAPVTTPAETSPTFWRRLSRDEFFMTSPLYQDSPGDRLFHRDCRAVLYESPDKPWRIMREPIVLLARV
ncbi:unannotated protein [freshwater metagenome]|uniref:Unannotated protein n=1 Tax=freshwater metagenome TaxID=449393 RepID=A0A6J7ILE4_9ZZZZ